MGGFSCFSCIGGNNGQSLQSPEPVRQVQVPAQSEKTASLPRTVSIGPKVVEEAITIASIGERQEDPEKAVSSTIPEPGPLAEFEFEDSQPPATANVSQKDTHVCERIEGQQSSVSSPVSDFTAPQPPQNKSQAIRTVSSASSRSKSSNLGSSLGHTCTEATTPPRTPTDTEAKPAERSQEGEDFPNSPLEEDFQQRKGEDDMTSISPQAGTPSEEPIFHENQSSIQNSDLKPLEASKPPSAHTTTTTLPALKTNPADHNTSTDLHSGRPSYENDTPLTPSAPTPTTTTTTTFSRPSLLRLSTAPASSQSTTNPTEKRKSRLSRFLSLSTTNKERKQQRKSLQFSGKEGAVGGGGMVDIPTAVAEVEGEGDEKLDSVQDQEERGGGEDDQVVGRNRGTGTAASKVVVVVRGEQEQEQSQSDWETEMKAKEAGLGRKWAEGGDNESLFCY